MEGGGGGLYTMTNHYYNFLIAQHICLKKGIDVRNDNMKKVAFTTVEACKEKCAKTEGCATFVTAAGTDNHCYLREDGDEEPNSLTIFGRMSCFQAYDKGNITTIITNRTRRAYD